MAESFICVQISYDASSGDDVSPYDDDSSYDGSSLLHAEPLPHDEVWKILKQQYPALESHRQTAGRQQ